MKEVLSFFLIIITNCFKSRFSYFNLCKNRFHFLVVFNTCPLMPFDVLFWHLVNSKNKIYLSFRICLKTFPSVICIGFPAIPEHLTTNHWKDEKRSCSIKTARSGYEPSRYTAQSKKYQTQHRMSYFISILARFRSSVFFKSKYPFFRKKLISLSYGLLELVCL